MKTRSLKAAEIQKDWYIADADGKTLGRFASEI
ncbi:MAG: 50S ribosomal protein L13, partial [Candidatus Marinimicrobia bacterium]|nr:50S ribosomal protein L13 [Candidatus Neomarinimicrobiota bacterium]